jgi:hypothetical protein
MINDGAKLLSFERELTRKSKADHQANIRLFEAMYAEAMALGIFPPNDPLAGIDVDIRIAKAINSVPRSS